MTFGVGSCVVVYLGSPREHVFGVLLSIDASGLVIRGIAVASVSEWLQELSVGAEGDVTSTFGLATTFYPMHRVEKVVLDEESSGAPPLHRRFEERTGMTLLDYVAREGAGPDAPARPRG